MSPIVQFTSYKILPALYALFMLPRRRSNSLTEKFKYYHLTNSKFAPSTVVKPFNVFTNALPIGDRVDSWRYGEC